MADTKISALPAADSVSGDNEFAINESGTSKKVTATQLADYIGTGLVTVKALGATDFSSSTDMAKVDDFDQEVEAGTWVFNYYIRYRSANTGNGLKVSVNHSGTVSSFVANYRFVCDSSDAATLTGDQSATGDSNSHVMTSFSTRAKSTSGMGPTTGVDAADSDMLLVIEGLMVVTNTGDLELYFASENGSVQVSIMEESVLILTKIASVGGG